MEGRPNSDPPAVRVGDAEREAVLDALSEHHAKGRLTVEELDRRQHAALAAETWADLDALLTDLPAIATQTPNAEADRPATSTTSAGREEMRALVTWGPPTAVTLGAAGWVATAGPFPDDSTKFLMAIGMATVGFVSHWWVSRRSG